MHQRRMLLISVGLILGLCQLWAVCPLGDVCLIATTTVPSPILNGGTCPVLPANTTVAVKVSAAINPIATTATTATYKVPVGAIVITIPPNPSFHNTIVGKMIYKIAAHDTVTLDGVGPLGSQISFVSTLVPGSFPNTVLGAGGNPAGLIPADNPEGLTSPSSYLIYSYDPATNMLCNSTKAGFTGLLKN